MTLGPPTSRDVLALFTIYDHPRDHPNSFVVRRWIVRGGGREEPREMALAMTLDEARAMLPPGLINLGREPGDDPVIVETWI